MKALEDATSFVERALDHADEIIYRFRVRPEPAFEFLTPSVGRLLGFERDELYANPSLAAVLVDDEDFQAEVSSTELRVREPYRVRVRRSDGEHRWFEVHNFTVRDVSGEVELIEGIARDVTASVHDAAVFVDQVDEALRIAKLGSWTWTVATEEAYWSKSLFLLCGIEPREEAPSFDEVVALVHPDDLHVVFDRGFAAIVAQDSFDLDHRVIRPDGRVLTVRTRGGPIIGADGKVERMIGTVHDISDVGPPMAEEAVAQLAKLSERELEVLTLLARGSDPRDIARALDISLHTVRDHLKAVRAKLDVRTQIEAVLVAVDAGILRRS